MGNGRINKISSRRRGSVSGNFANCDYLSSRSGSASNDNEWRHAPQLRSRYPTWIPLDNTAGHTACTPGSGGLPSERGRAGGALAWTRAGGARLGRLAALGPVAQGAVNHLS